ncbi:hypothetical protein HF086_007763 [Spodoptera exigua]|uniref:MADF domain-containing protein n=1 Tax=Spodoptera exigua TaxID=7107 RepID=A0A922SIS4_SPOEX|nr:hypothetical protein HF086_002702 [Spodoptera exigua]KAH9638054.1 hypothetical protein HF086_014915 [Spodoptera exigua]KAH9638629.1 hypothetical protein HF086_007763 [Spodoptera exigua]
MPYLWNKNDKNYMNKTIRSEGFEVLLSIYKNIEKDATVKTLKKKIDNLKTNYFKELKKVKASKHTGAGSEDVYVPTIWYYDSFSFLETTTESCRSIRDTIEDEDSSLSCIEDTQMTNNSTSNQNMFKKKKKEAPLKQQDILEKASELLNTKEEDWEILGRSIGMQLRDVNQQQHIIARKLISDVIFYATLNKLSEESFVGVTTHQSKASYPWFTPSRSSSAQSEFHPVRTSSPYQSPYPQSPNSPLCNLPPQQQMQSSHPSASTQYHSQSSNTRHNLPLQQQIQSSHFSQSPEYHSQSSNSLHYLPPQQKYSTRILHHHPHNITANIQILFILYHFSYKNNLLQPWNTQFKSHTPQILYHLYNFISHPLLHIQLRWRRQLMDLC